MKPIVPIATVSNATIDALDAVHVRTLAVLQVGTRHDELKWEAKGNTVALLRCGYDDCRVTVDGAVVARGTLGTALEAIKQLVATLEAARFTPTPTARRYKQYGIWVDVQDGYLMCYAMDTDGGWDEDPAAIEFTCQHMLDRVNADFGTDFTMDEFQQGDACTCGD